MVGDVLTFSVWLECVQWLSADDLKLILLTICAKKKQQQTFCVSKERIVLLIVQVNTQRQSVIFWSIFALIYFFLLLFDNLTSFLKNPKTMNL